jgi:hypothetical protein
MKRWPLSVYVLLFGLCAMLLIVTQATLGRSLDYTRLVAVSWGDGAVPALYGAYVFYEPRKTQLMVRATVYIDRPTFWSGRQRETIDLGLVRDEAVAVRQWGQITWSAEGVQFGHGPQAVKVSHAELAQP